MSTRSEAFMDAAAAARKIADKLAALADNKVGEAHKHQVAMSAGARLVAVKLVELADQAMRDSSPEPPGPIS